MLHFLIETNVPRPITAINLQGLSNQGQASIKENAYFESQRSFPMALFLLLITGVFGIHRINLWQYKLGIAIFLIHALLRIATSFAESSAPLLGYFILFILIELAFLSGNTEAANRKLKQSLDSLTP